MDERRYLNLGSVIDFPGMSVTIEAFVGMGSNACVYKGSYEDGLNAGMRHTVLVKELFPYDAQGGIFRNESGAIVVRPEAEETYALHRKSFERGNEAHLRLLSARPDLIGGNINTAKVNGTLYTILAESGGTDFRRAEKPATLKIAARRVLSILDALSAFHDMSLCHLDISPDNILLVGSGENERAMLIDFNSVFSLSELAFGEGEYFSVKPGYTSPEVVNKTLAQVSFASDLYSIAAVFYTLVSGAPMTLSQMLSKTPPDVSECEIMKNAPETVKMQVRSILKKGLSALPSRRYRTISEMRDAFEELMMRIDMLGVTHSSLWEAGRRAVQSLTKNNPFYAFLNGNDRMFPVRISNENGESADINEFVSKLTGEEGKSVLCVSAGGMGKTTLLLKTALMLSEVYAPNRPAQLYISLAGRAAQKKDLILDAILENLRFTKDTVTYEGARHQLKTLLSSPLKSRAGELPALVILLDGLNEVKGDPSYLIEEIALIEQLSGVRLFVTSRSDTPNLRFEKCAVSPLFDEDIRAALSARGLLMPKSEEIRNLLKTPLMLSLFIEASGMEKQLRVEKEEQLMQAYVSSLLGKEKEALGEEEAEKYRVDAALNYILPALSHALIAGGGALTDAELFPAALRCRKTLYSRYLSRAFPAWLGHRRELCMETGDDFYGKYVHEILWKRMGLLVMDEQKMRISHAKIGEYLAGLHEENRKRLLKWRLLRYSVMTAAGAVIISLAVTAAVRWLPRRTVEIIRVVEEEKRPAYDDAKMLEYVENSVTAYSKYGLLYDLVSKLVETGREGNRIGFDTCYEDYIVKIGKATKPQRSTNKIASEIEAMEALPGEVCSWSNREVDFDTAVRLIKLESACAQTYAEFLPVYKFWLENEEIREYYISSKKQDYTVLLERLLNADAKVAAMMFQITGGAHLDGMKEENETIRKTYRTLIAEMSEIEKERYEVYGEEALIDLEIAEKERTDIITEIRKLNSQLENHMR